jgi:UDP-2,3-diacylglucosamine pyrophosphatase LpxH
MLVIISDLHLNDGTTGAAIHPGAFQIFAERLSDLATRASWRTDGRYRPIDHMELVLLGDVFDIIRSRRWLQSGTRPWEDPQSPKIAESVSSIVDAVLDRNRDAINVLRSLYGEGAIHIPPVGQSGTPLYGVEGHSVAVRTFYMVGNHDWPLHLRGPRYDLIRQKVANQVGLVNAPSEPFPHDAGENDELVQVLRRHRVLARHGDIFDPINYNEDRNACSLGDAIVIELVTRFAVELEQVLGDELPPQTLAGLQQMDHIRPLLLIPAWIEGLLQRTNVPPTLRKHIKRIWDRLADEFLQLPIVRNQDTWSPFDLVDGLERALKFSKRLPIGWINRITQWMHRLRGAKSDSYYLHALTEEDFRNRRARHIVYGHTHHAESLPLDASYADGYVLNQMYFNTGSWRRVYRPTCGGPGDFEFIPTECLNFLAFFCADERGGRPFETWSGTLAVDTADNTIHRVDAGRSSHASTQSIPTPRVPVRAPHFPNSPATAPAPAKDRF